MTLLPSHGPVTLIRTTLTTTLLLLEIILTTTLLLLGIIPTTVLIAVVSPAQWCGC